jgi:hypothetical protein
MRTVWSASVQDGKLIKLELIKIRTARLIGEKVKTLATIRCSAEGALTKTVIR